MSFDSDNSNHNGNHVNHNGSENSISQTNDLLEQQRSVVHVVSISSTDMAYISSLYDRQNVEFRSLYAGNQDCLDVVYRVYLALRYKSYGQWYYYQSLCYHLQASTHLIDTAQSASSPIYTGLKNPTNRTCKIVVDFYENKMDTQDKFTKYVIGLMKTFDLAAIYRAQGLKKGNVNKRQNCVNGNLVPSTHSSKMFKKRGKKRKADKSANDEKEPKKPKIVGEGYLNVVKCCSIVLCIICSIFFLCLLLSLLLDMYYQFLAFCLLFCLHSHFSVSKQYHIQK